MLIDAAHHIWAVAAGSQHLAETGGVIHTVILEQGQAAGLETRSLAARSFLPLYEVQLVREFDGCKWICVL